MRGVMENTSAQQILEAIAGATGLQYTITDEKVVISSAAVDPNRREPNIGFVQLDIGMQVLVPPESLSSLVFEQATINNITAAVIIRKLYVIFLIVLHLGYLQKSLTGIIVLLHNPPDLHPSAFRNIFL